MFSVLMASLALAASAPQLTAPQAPLDARTAVYELRIYHPPAGKLSNLNERFHNHTLRLFAKHGMRNVAFWNELPTKDAPEGRMIFILAYPSREAREASWKAFVEDPEWKDVAAKSEANGKIVSKVENLFMTMTDYSPHFSAGGVATKTQPRGRKPTPRN
jgi:hypothetical protein